MELTNLGLQGEQLYVCTIEASNFNMYLSGDCSYTIRQQASEFIIVIINYTRGGTDQPFTLASFSLFAH